jgi:hypothetical protein
MRVTGSILLLDNGVWAVPAQPLLKGATSPPGWVWYRGRCRPVIARYLAASPSVVIARRLHCNVLTVALANKLARIALTVLVQGRNYETRIETTAA